MSNSPIFDNMKKIKKLTLNINTISNLSDEKMGNINGGDIFDTMGGACGSYNACGPSQYGCNVTQYNCGASFAGTGTGYGMCCCNATGYCS